MLTDVYTRLSRDRPDQTSTERQRLDCCKLIEAKGWIVGTVHEDVDLSAYRNVRRPSYEQLIDRVKHREIQAVVVWKIDRLARSIKEFLRFAEICEKHDVALVSVHEPFDTSSPIGRAIMQVLAVFAELESATIGMRVRSAREHAANKGQRSPGARMFGYEPDMLIRATEADAAVDAASRVLSGESLRGIATQWNERGLTRTNGGPWTGTLVGRTLRSPHLAGLRVHHGEVIGEGDWSGIIDRSTHEALVGRKQWAAPSRRRYLLTGGLARCGLCHSALVGKVHDKRPMYLCRECQRVGVSCDPLEAMVRELTFAALERPDVRDALSRHDESPQIDVAALRVMEGRLSDLGIDYAAGRVPRAAFLSATQELERDIAQMRERFETRQRPVFEVMTNVEAEWDRRDLSWRAALVSMVFTRFDIMPVGRTGRRPFDPSRVRPVLNVTVE